MGGSTKVHNIFSNFIRLLFRLTLIVIVFMGTGIFATILISLWYVNSPGYCRDCDTGLGLCCIGFVIGPAATLILIYLMRHFIILPIPSEKDEPSDT
jgi:hypothetical protein